MDRLGTRAVAVRPRVRPSAGQRSAVRRVPVMALARTFAARRRRFCTRAAADDFGQHYRLAAAVN